MASVCIAVTELDQLLERLESSAMRLESRYDFLDTERALASLAHLRNRVCILLRSSLQRALEAAEGQVQEVLFELQEHEATSTVDTQIFYTNFHMISPSFRPALAVLLRHSRAQPQYASTLDDLERFFATLRLRLVAGAAAAHWTSLRETAARTPGSLPALARQSIAYLMDTTSREKRCFEAFFAPRGTHEALDDILAHLGLLFQEAMQPACAAASWVDLAASAEVVKAELAEQREALACRTPVRAALASLLGASRRRLFAEARRVLLSADLSDDLSDLQYPGALFQAAAWQPKSLSRPLSLLAASYQVLEVSDFEALLDIVASSSPVWLRLGAEKIDQNGDNTAPTCLHGRFFLLRNLLTLQEQLAAFEDDSSALGVSEALRQREDEFTMALERLGASDLRLGRGRRGASLRKHLEEVSSELLTELTGLCVRAPEVIRTASSTSLLQPLSTERPNVTTFPAAPVQHHLPPFGTDVTGPKATNKFWANWVVEEGRGLAIHPMPYVLQFASQPGEAPNLKVSRSQTPHVTYGDSDSNGRDKIRYYFSPVINEFGLGAAEPAGQEGHVVVKEGLFGIHVELRGPSGTARKMTFPIYSGMAYVSAHYEGGFTPKITSERALLGVDPIQDGVWRLTNNGGREFRLYAILASGEFADGTYQFDSQGLMNKPFEGWLRLAEVQAASDVDVLDQHAGAILTDWDMDVELGSLRYQFSKSGRQDISLLHFGYAHHESMLTGASHQISALTPMRPPTKGEMVGVVGDSWTLDIDTTEVQQLGFLPANEPSAEHAEFLSEKVRGTVQWFLHSDQWKLAMFRGSYYFSGKGFQKVAYVCLLLEKFHGTDHGETQACAEILAKGFRCLYDRSLLGCDGAPIGSYYDDSWGGVASREGYGELGCRVADFGNACYNDHHYHFSYYVVSAAILVKLKPEYSSNGPFVSFVETLIRDTANPSRADAYFPTFRAFDWFDLHSWSRGVVPSADGKDQESTSEELNLLYGIQLWGSMMQKPALRDLGATMLALCAFTVREFFLMKSDNVHHPADFVTNHVTGIFFQNKVDYATWFGWRYEYIHGIQMLPLTPALLLSRTPEFCAQEWSNVLSQLALPSTDPWSSILLTGTLALVDPAEAYTRLMDISDDFMDDGLTKVWALYWAATASAGTPAASTTAGSTTAAGTTAAGTTAAGTTASTTVNTGSTSFLAPTTTTTTTTPTTTTTTTTTTVAGTTRTPFPEVNLALERRTEASSEAPTFTSMHAVDGLFATRWSPAAEDAVPWLAVELDAIYELSFIVVVWQEFHPTGYDIQTKDSSGTWVTLASQVGRAGAVKTDLQGSVSWLRLLCHGGSEIRIFEFQVYGTLDTQTTTTTEPVETGTSTTTTTPFDGLNLAQGKPVLASSFRSPTEFAYRAVDGILETRWASAASPEQWIWVDLLGAYDLTSVLVLWGPDFPGQYSIQTAPNGIDWTTAAVETGMAGPVRTTLESVTGQWIRILCHGNTGCSIDELRIFGADPSYLTTTTVTTSAASSGASSSATSSTSSTPTTSAGETTSTATTTTGSRPAVNLALHQPALASTGLHQTRAVDGSLTTQWSSLSGDQTPWLWVDLRGRHDVSEVIISWGAEFPAEFRIEAGYSAAAWSPVATAAGQANSEVRVVFNPVNLQFLRILCTNLGSSSRCSIRELEVFNSGPPQSTTTQATVASTAGSTATTTITTTMEATTSEGQPSTTTSISTDAGSQNASATTTTITTTLAPNVALRKPIRASSQRSPTEYAARANDGDEGTQWASAGSPTEWILIDLLGSYVLQGGVVLWGDAVPASYGLEVSSDGVNWAPVFDEMAPSEDYRNYNDLPSIIGQWLKVTCHNEGTAGCSMKEVQVHGIRAADVTLAELEQLAQRTKIPFFHSFVKGSVNGEPRGAI
ncbi:unnamed protein product [Symbiodinium natans]|uniref:glucan endo-1,3-beta-D-glucosidase n=1 Tax=Symbiodinium natans TaxID=878477 RepID=A0A812PR93_9DINO|nr:unnamed protein product [Symbiodinium natans]